MENKINIAELLKNCPRGMELDCVMYDYDNVTFLKVSTEGYYPIEIVTKNGFSITLTKYGQNVAIEDAKCVIFPKGKTTWEGFVPPCKFKAGDWIVFNGLEVKDMDLDREIEKELKTRWCGEYLNTDKFKESAKYFFELGLKAQKGE